MSRALLIFVLLFYLTRAQADPDEASIIRASLPAGLHPLLVLLVDRGAAMANTVAARPRYDAAIDYGGELDAGTRCDRYLVYWRRGAGPAPDCLSQRGLDPAPASDLQGLQCQAARGVLATHGFFVAARAAQWRVAAPDGYWAELRPDRLDAIECRSDRGRHGAAPGGWFAADGPDGPWSESSDDEIAWNHAPHADAYVFYTGNYLNYLQSTAGMAPRQLADIAAESLAAVTASVDELEVALVATSATDGGYVALAATDAASAAARLPSLLAGDPAGGAPLAETIAEAGAWLAGVGAPFGGQDAADSAAFESTAPYRYRSPVSHACRAVTLALLTAGRPSADESAALAAASLPGFRESAGNCGSNCLAALAGWLDTADLRTDLPGRQSAQVRWLVPPGVVAPLAPASGPNGHLDDPHAFVEAVVFALQNDAAIAALPGLTAAALLPAQDGAHAPAVLFGLTLPSPALRWSGNLFRYALRAPDSPLGMPQIVDRDGNPAIDEATGLPRPSSRSQWSDDSDVDLIAGGAAGRLPAAPERRLFTDLASDELSDPANRLAPGNPRLDRSLFGLTAADARTPDSLVAWLAGERRLGDPGPHSPAVAAYPDRDLHVVFIATHDGLLHAIDADDGTELWAFLPRELLPRLAELARNPPTSARSHGIDGAITVHRDDRNGDGRIDTASGEHLLLLFGMGRGGSSYYSLDISSPLDPRVLWSNRPAPSGFAESWAPPVVTRLSIGDQIQSAGHWIVLLAGGYDPAFDVRGSRLAGAGSRLDIVDALTGVLLWRAAGLPAEDVQLAVPGLEASLPSAPRVLDGDGDGELDRAYVVDVTGRLFRFDFVDGQPAASLATARLIARLGDGRQRFFASPDVSLLRPNGRLQTVLAAGSGWLSRPRDIEVIDRVYVIHDPDSAGTVLTDDSLHDATDATDPVPSTVAGWFLQLDRHGSGEKVVGSTLTFDRVLRFQTYQPLPAVDDAPCGPPRAVRRLYAYDISTALPRPRVAVSEEDDPAELPGAGLPVELRFAFPRRYETPCAGCRPRPVGFAGASRIDPAYFGDPVRTSWRKLPPDSR